MTNSKELITFILEYESYVKKGNEILQSYFKIKKSPLLAKREGKIPAQGKIESNNMVFNFHGMGCRFEFGEVVIDFDYSFGDFIYKGFEASKLYWFIESYSDADSKMTREEVNEHLKELEIKGIIISKDESSYDTYDYIYVNNDKI